MTITSWCVFLEVVALSSFFGGVGGSVAFLSSDGKEARTWSHPMLASIWIGIGGALGFVFFVASVGGVTELATTTERLRLMSVGTIAGFGARRLLPLMVGQLEKQMANTDKKASQALAASTKTEEEVRASANRIRNLELNGRLLFAEGNEATDDDRQAACEQAEDLVSSGDAQPLIWINLGRVYRRLGRYQEAIALLKRFLEKHQSDATQRRNIVAANYNLACYLCLHYSTSQDPKPPVLEQAGSYLEKSFEFSHNVHADLEYADKDPHLEALRADTSWPVIRARIEAKYRDGHT